jgi:hypothetical protein
VEEAYRTYDYPFGGRPEICNFESFVRTFVGEADFFWSEFPG